MARPRKNASADAPTDSAQGASRVLKVGDTLQKGETIRTVGEVSVRKGDLQFDEYPEESIAQWHERLGLSR